MRTRDTLLSTPLLVFLLALPALPGCAAESIDELALELGARPDSDRKFPCAVDPVRGTHPSCKTTVGEDGAAVKDCGDKCIVEEIDASGDKLVFVHKECNKPCDQCGSGPWVNKPTNACGNCHVKDPTSGDDCVVNGNCVAIKTSKCKTPMVDCHPGAITLDPPITTPDGKKWSKCIPNSAFCEDKKDGCPET